MRMGKWSSPEGKTLNQIDHIGQLVDCMHRLYFRLRAVEELMATQTISWLELDIDSVLQCIDPVGNKMT